MGNILRSFSIAIVGTFLLSGCASVFPLSDPAGTCNGKSVSITASPTRPVSTAGLVEGGEETEITLTVKGDLSDLEVAYSLGIYNETGVDSVNLDFISGGIEPSPEPTGKSFLGFGEGTFTTVLDNSDFQAGPNNSHTLSEPFAALVFPEADFDEVEVLALLLPGAFVVMCSAVGADEEGELVAAAQVFPNLVIFEGSEGLSLSVDGESVNFSVPAEYEGSQIALIGNVVSPSTPKLSEDRATDRWLQLLSISQEAIDNGEVLEALGTVGPGGLVDLEFGGGLFSGGNAFEPGVEISLIMLIFEIDGEGLLGFKTAIFDVSISDTGEGTFRVVSPISAGSKTPFVGANQKVTVSTKGYRKLQLEGQNLIWVSSAKVGSKAAKILKKSKSSITLQLPKNKPGQFRLEFVHANGQIEFPKFVSYVNSSKIDNLVIKAKTPDASWSGALSKALLDNNNAVQVNCVARIAVGENKKKWTNLANKVCSSVPDENVKTKVIVRDLPAGSSSSILVTIWD